MKRVPRTIVTLDATSGAMNKVFYFSARRWGRGGGWCAHSSYYPLTDILSPLTPCCLPTCNQDRWETFCLQCVVLGQVLCNSRATVCKTFTTEKLIMLCLSRFLLGRLFIRINVSSFTEMLGSNSAAQQCYEYRPLSSMHQAGLIMLRGFPGLAVRTLLEMKNITIKVVYTLRC